MLCVLLQNEHLYMIHAVSLCLSREGNFMNMEFIYPKLSALHMYRYKETKTEPQASARVEPSFHAALCTVSKHVESEGEGYSVMFMHKRYLVFLIDCTASDLFGTHKTTFNASNIMQIYCHGSQLLT